MKYIRTKDGRIIKNAKPRLVSWREDVNDEWKIKETDLLEGENGLCLKEDIIKQADSIEELCDEFVCENTVLDYEQKTKLLAVGFTKVYGAIWTNKGLIYVAKMNENGEMELL